MNLEDIRALKFLDKLKDPDQYQKLIVDYCKQDPDKLKKLKSVLTYLQNQIDVQKSFKTLLMYGHIDFNAAIDALDVLKKGLKGKSLNAWENAILITCLLNRDFSKQESISDFGSVTPYNKLCDIKRGDRDHHLKKYLTNVLEHIGANHAEKLTVAQEYITGNYKR